MRVCNFTKNMLLYKYFSRFLLRFVVFYKDFLKIFTNFCFPENLLVALADSGLRKPKTLNVSSCNLIIPKWQNIHVISNRKCTTKIPLKYITKPVELVYFIFIRWYSEPFQTSRQWGYLLEGNYFPKKLHLRCFARLWMCYWAVNH